MRSLAVFLAFALGTRDTPEAVTPQTVSGRFVLHGTAQVDAPGIPMSDSAVSGDAVLRSGNTDQGVDVLGERGACLALLSANDRCRLARVSRMDAGGYHRLHAMGERHEHPESSSSSGSPVAVWQ